MRPAPCQKFSRAGLPKAVLWASASILLGSCTSGASEKESAGVRDLVTRLGSSEEEDRLEAQKALIALGAGSVRPLLEAFPSEHVGLRIFYRTVVVRMKEATPPSPFPGADLGGPIPPYPILAETLVKIGGPAVRELVLALRTAEEPELLAILDILSRIGGPAVGPMVGEVQGANPGLAVRVVEALGDMGPAARRAVPELVGLLGRGDPALQRALARSLPRMDPRSLAVARELELLVRRSPNEEVREAAAQGLKVLERSEGK